MLKLPLFLFLLTAFTGKEEAIPPSQKTDLERSGYHGTIKTITTIEYSTNKWGDHDTERIVEEYGGDGNMVISTRYSRYYINTDTKYHSESASYTYHKREGSFPSYTLSVDSFTNPHSCILISYKLDSMGNIKEQTSKQNIHYTDGDTTSINRSEDGYFSFIEINRHPDTTYLYMNGGDTTYVALHIITQQRDSLGNITRMLKYDSMDEDKKKTTSYRSYEFY